MTSREKLVSEVNPMFLLVCLRIEVSLPRELITGKSGLLLCLVDFEMCEAFNRDELKVV